MANRPRTLVLVSALALASAPTILGACDKSGGGASEPGSGSGSGSVYRELDITLPNLDDDEVTLASATANDLHVLAFWAIWCIPCTAELAKMNGMYERLADKGLNLYAISIDGPDTIARVPGYASQEGWSFPVLYDSGTEIMGRYNPKGDIPFYVILDADGNIVKTHQGYVKGDVAELEKFLTAKLEGAEADAPAEDAPAESDAPAEDAPAEDAPAEDEPPAEADAPAKP